MVIYLIRHGETASNAARIVQTPETPLSERGIDQAGRLARRLEGEKITMILSSDLKRAVMTAERLAVCTGAAIVLEPHLQERNYGDVRGLPYSEVAADILSPGYEPPGGETWLEFHARVDLAWAAIRSALASASGNLAVVTHGLVCHSLALRHLSLPAGIAVPRIWRNASVTTIEARPPWSATALDCAAHLEQSHERDASPRL